MAGVRSVLQPGNEGLSGGVPSATRFAVLSAAAGGSAEPIRTLRGAEGSPYTLTDSQELHCPMARGGTLWLMEVTPFVKG